ncbi:regulatory LuxR family protein [Solirubrobacter pauli]|uniref:Regulatory LuxR family protein n=1 Tax=Solirubrobacter pauli TaxID=166793 RepID=A0A660L1D5_9ACTN|nr:LuxR family transcriptional regulator [Solirubrobacter pauli]RKQ86702.1 regulatory LuxR family protein [Solirubrobacter pauli]
MITVADAELLERETELLTLRAQLDAARHGCGSVVLVEAPAGQGKTTLLRAARAEAAAAGLRTLSAIGADLERDFAFGVIRQLLPDLDDAVADSHARLHGLYERFAALAGEQPLAIVVDDAQWADAGSLKTLGMLARRIEHLPVVLIAGLRPDQHEPLIDALFAAPAATVLHPAPLSPDAVSRLVATALDGELDPEFAHAASRTTGGNPLLVRELRRTLAAGGFTGSASEADAVRRAVPGTIARLVHGRLNRLSPEALALARAVAIVCPRTDPGVAYALAGLPEPLAAGAHAALAGEGLLEAGRLRYTHAMMREAVYASVVPATRSLLHRRAARLMQEAGADESLTAAQLLAAEPARDPDAAAVLTRTGEAALRSGDPDVAVHHLRRALAETAASRPAPAAGRDEAVPLAGDVSAPAALLLLLGLAESRAGDPAAHAHLQAAAAAGDPVVAARAAQALARVHVVSGRAEQAADTLDRAIERVRPVDPELAADLEDDLLDGLNYDHDLAEERRRRLARAEDRPAVLAHRAFELAARGAPSDEVRAVAERALADGALFERPEQPAVLYAIEALMAVEAAAEAQAAIERLCQVVRRAGSRVGTGGVAMARARWEHEFGNLEAAQEAGRVAIEIQAGLSGGGATRSVRTALAAALLDAGDVDEAEQLLAEALVSEARDTVLPICGFNALRGRILLERGRPQEAIAEIEQHLALERRRGWVASLRNPTRATLITALADAGRLDEARALAQAQLSRARARGLHGHEARVLVAGARLALARDEEVEWLEQAVAAARRSPSRLILAEALTAYGAALRRANRRADARDPLREARELALLTGAKALEKRAHDELVIAGARPQRVAVSGPEGLTPSERRVAELAAQGHRNRDIAEALFVTLKTVEVHLGRAYGKLGISSRSQLADTLGGYAAR